MFYYIYLLVATLIYVVALPFLLLLLFKKKYKESIPARFFLYKNKPLVGNGIHFHICSYGEAKSIKAIVDRLDIKKLRFTSITNTGYSVINEYSQDNSRYLPFEIFLPFWIKQQKVLVVVEAELWYMLFKSYKLKSTKTFLINARISENSFPKYMRFKWIYKHIFNNIDSVYAQTYEDARRLKYLGAHNIKVAGNIKFCNINKPNKQFPKNYKLIITAGSTHEGEEELIFNAFKKLQKIENSQLIVVPRHPDRFDKVAVYLEKEALKSKLTFSRYSQDRSFMSDIVLMDVMGELINSYAISDIVILGGAFANVGGHNAIEAALFNCKIITGKNYYNQKELFRLVDGLTIIDDYELDATLLDYARLPKSHINTKCSLDELVKEIKSVL